MTPPAVPAAERRAATAGRRRWVPVIAWVVALVALGGVSLAYLQPEFAVDLATRFWSCF